MRSFTSSWQSRAQPAEPAVAQYHALMQPNLGEQNNPVRAFVSLSLALIAIALAYAPPAFCEELAGQVTCSVCWFEADRTRVVYGTEADMECARACADSGIDAALAVRGADAFKLYLLVGNPPEGGRWLDWIGKYVKAEGELTTKEDQAAFRTRQITALDQSPWPLQPSPTDASQKAESTAQIHERTQLSLTWTDLLGNLVDLQRWHDRIVVINFWATWCKPCVEEMPELVELHDQFAPFGVEFIGAAADPPSQTSAVIEFVRKLKINFPIFVGANTEQMESLGLTPALPATVVLNNGEIVERIPGIIDQNKLQKLLSRLVDQQARSTASSEPSEEKQAKKEKRRARRAARAARHTHDHSTHASLVPS